VSIANKDIAKRVAFEIILVLVIIRGHFEFWVCLKSPPNILSDVFKALAVIMLTIDIQIAIPGKFLFKITFSHQVLPEFLSPIEFLIR
jgi:hypothetical protein